MVKKARTLSLTFFLALILILAPVFSASAETAKNSWNGITWEFESILGALFINGRGFCPLRRPCRGGIGRRTTARSVLTAA